MRNVKKPFGIFGRKVPNEIYIYMKYGIADFNAVDFDKYTKMKDLIPSELSDSFAKPLGCCNHSLFGKLFFEELVRDYDSRVSRTLKDSRHVDNGFWSRLRDIRDFCLDKRVYFFDLHQENVLVKRKSENEAIPVIMDYKRIGRDTYGWQQLLMIDYFAKQKIKRRFDRLFKLRA